MLRRYFYVLAALLLVLSSSFVFAQGQAGDPSDAVVGDKPVKAVAETGTLSPTFLINYPNQVQRYRFGCAGGTPYSYYAIIGVRDTEVTGDIWKATVKIYDRAPASTVIIGSGSLTSYNYGLVYNWMKDPFWGEIEVRYDHGIDQFACHGQIYVTCPGTLTLWTFPLSEF